MSDAVIDILAQRLKFYRMRHGFTQSRIAEVIDVTFQQVQKYENGKNRIPVDKLYMLAQLYQVAMDDFFVPITSD